MYNNVDECRIFTGFTGNGRYSQPDGYRTAQVSFQQHDRSRAVSDKTTGPETLGNSDPIIVFIAFSSCVVFLFFRVIRPTPFSTDTRYISGVRDTRLGRNGKTKKTTHGRGSNVQNIPTTKKLVREKQKNN